MLAIDDPFRALLADVALCFLLAVPAKRVKRGELVNWDNSESLEAKTALFDLLMHQNSSFFELSEVVYERLEPGLLLLKDGVPVAPERIQREGEFLHR